MLISHSKKFIFIHVYKVAGSSINKALSGYCSYSSRSRNPIKKLKTSLGITPDVHIRDFQGHVTAAELKDQMDQAVFDRYFKFAFVRNPWDWQVSLYHFALQDPKHPQHSLTQSFGSFEKYIEWRVKEDLHLQKEFVYDSNDNLLLDFVGKMENLQADFDTVCDRIGVKRMNLPHTNKSERKGFEDYYTPYTRDLVREYFQEDIAAFGY